MGALYNDVFPYLDLNGPVLILLLTNQNTRKTPYKEHHVVDWNAGQVVPFYGVMSLHAFAGNGRSQPFEWMSFLD